MYQCLVYSLMKHKGVALLQEPIALRNRELLILKAQLQRRVEELQRELEAKHKRGVHSPARLTKTPESPVNVWCKGTRSK